MTQNMVDQNSPAQFSTRQRPSTMRGLIAGSLIRTGDGEIPIEFLNPGDRIISRKHGMVVLEDMRVELVKASVVRINPGALGKEAPYAATLMHAEQTVLVRGPSAEQNGSTVAVGALINGKQVTALGKRTLRLVQLMFRSPDIIYSDGIEVVVAEPLIASQAWARSA